MILQSFWYLPFLGTIILHFQQSPPMIGSNVQKADQLLYRQLPLSWLLITKTSMKILLSHHDLLWFFHFQFIQWSMATYEDYQSFQIIHCSMATYGITNLFRLFKWSMATYGELPIFSDFYISSQTTDTFLLAVNGNVWDFYISSQATATFLL